MNSPPVTYRRLSKGPRIVLWILAISAVIVLGDQGLRMFGSLFERPTFTLFVHAIDGEQEASNVVAVVVASRESAWAEIAAHPADGEKVLWIEQVSGMKSARLFGSYTVCGKELSFQPAVPLTAGAMYHIVFHPPGSSAGEVAESSRSGFGSVSGKGKLELIHQVPSSAGVSAPTIRSLHPTSDELPPNHLKFYITFSEPMEQGVFMERIRLLRADGKEISGPFRETELWSPDGKRLTVWLHPGRQKTGVNLNADEGPVLREGESISFVISGDWRSTSGKKLGADFKRTYHVTKADHDPVDPSKWTVLAPKANTRQRLEIAFAEPLDAGLLTDSLTVLSPDGKAAKGIVGVGSSERTWHFTPDENWSAGEYSIEVKPELEDLAGNNLNGPFELDAASGSTSRQRSMSRLSFLIE